MNERCRSLRHVTLQVVSSSISPTQLVNRLFISSFLTTTSFTILVVTYSTSRFVQDLGKTEIHVLEWFSGMKKFEKLIDKEHP